MEGFTFSGVPGVVIGHNGRIAWGFTNLDPDVTDLYLEKIRGNQYQVDGKWRDLAIRTETINVAGGKPVSDHRPYHRTTGHCCPTRPPTCARSPVSRTSTRTASRWPGR